MKPIRNNYKFKVFLGTTKPNLYGEKTNVYLTGFSWDCDWYWGGGYIKTKNMHTHFNSCFLDIIDSRGHCLGNFFDPWTTIPNYIKPENVIIIKNGCSIWEDLETFLDNIPEHISKNWWRIKDLYKQFYILRRSAETFQLGGHCTSDNRNPKEINKKMADNINKHIETVIIPEIIKVLQVEIN